MNRIQLKACLVTVVLTLLCITTLSACNSESTSSAQAKDQAKDIGSMKKSDAIRLQTLSFKWQSETLSHSFVCAPTQFPPVKVGGGDPFSGATGGRGRGVKAGWSPVLQWAVVQSNSENLLVRLGCEGQWQGLEQVQTEHVINAIEVFALHEINSVIGISPVTVSNLSLTPPRKVKETDEISAQMSTQMKRLRPLAGILRAYPKASLTDPTLIAFDRTLAPKDERPFLSEPWVIRCEGALPAVGTALSANPVTGSFFTKKGQPALDSSPAFKGCTFIKYFDVSSINYGERPRSPYPESVLHLMTETGAETFVETKMMTLRDPQLLLHANDKGSFRGALERDPFLNTDFFKKNIAGELSYFEGRSSK